MSETVTELYTDADMERMRQKGKIWQRALCILAGAALAVCVGLALLAGTESALRMELAAVAVSTVAGWIVIYGVLFVVTPLRRELAHAAMLRTEERQRVEGEAAVTDERFTIRKSVAVRRVEVRREGEEPVRLLVCASRAGALAGASALYVCHGYVAAYEVRP